MIDRTCRRLPTPALVISVIALIVAIGGGTFAIAASNGSRVTKIVRRIANAQINRRTPRIAGRLIQRRAPNLSVAHADTAGSAGAATNAAELGGLPASGYTHSDCTSETGQIKGFARVPASAAFPSTYTNVGGYNCSGQAVQAKRIGAGWYEVRFLGSSSNIAVATSDAGAGGTAYNDNVGLLRAGPGEFIVSVWEVPGAGEARDDPFSMILP